MGFKILNEMETIVNVSNANYGIVGFGFLVATRLVPLMFLGVWGNPSLGLGSTSNLVISHVLLIVWSWLCTDDEGDTLVNEGKLRWFHGSVWCLFSWLISFILLTIRHFGCGYRWHGMRGASWFRSLQLVLGWCHRCTLILLNTQLFSPLGILGRTGLSHFLMGFYCGISILLRACV